MNLPRRSYVKLNRSGAAISVLAATALLLAGCGSDNNAPASGSARAPQAVRQRQMWRAVVSPR